MIHPPASTQVSQSRSAAQKNVADYAAIAVAPILIFLMISSLGNFLTTMLYHGQYPSRVSWILMMYTFGTVAVARVAIEQDRNYSLGYAAVLGLVAFLGMIRFLDSFIFVIFILIVIGYLSDAIVRDCTLIDENVDSSDQGLVDAGRIFVHDQLESNEGLTKTNFLQRASSESDIHTDDSKQDHHVVNQFPKNKAKQPGRTVMYLAFAALPLFGLGQIFLRNDTATWERAQRLLAFYLFSSLSLLVTTSFLGLRRYLRQREAEMPNHVAVGWIVGGLSLILLILTIAFAIPVPGQALAGLDMGVVLNGSQDLTPSQFGWGGEGATPKDSEAAEIAQPEQPEGDGKTAAQLEAKEGAAAEGKKESGPAGKQQGGKQSSGKQSSGKQSSNQKATVDPSGNQPQEKPESPKRSESSKLNGQKQNGAQDANQSNQNSNTQNKAAETSAKSANRDDPPGGKKQDPASQNSGSGQKPQEPQQGDKTEPSSKQKDAERQSETEDEKQKSSTGNSDQRSQRDNNQTKQQQQQQQQQSSDRGSSTFLTSLGRLLGGLLKLLLYLALISIVVLYLWKNRDELIKWWNQWFQTNSPDANLQAPTRATEKPKEAFRRFDSYRNPIQQGIAPAKVVIITFQAFEAWSREKGLGRHQEETPAEFVRRFVKQYPEHGPVASKLVDSYQRLAYGRMKVHEDDIKSAASTWKIMTSHKA